MKYYLLFLLSICSFNVQAKQILSSKKNSNNALYKIDKIINQGSLYIIYAKRNDSTFQIISLKDTIYSNLEKIRIGNKYQLYLTTIYPNSSVEKIMDSAGLNAKDSCFLSQSKKTHYSLYAANNLSGLYVLHGKQSRESIINRFSIYSIFCDACKKNKFLIRLYIK